MKEQEEIQLGGSCLFCGVQHGEKHKFNCNMLTEEEVTTICQPKKETKTALSEQIGGDHYKSFAIQPLEFITKNKLSFVQGCVIKRICRYNIPGGKEKEDLLKVIHEIQCLIDIEY